MFNEKPTREEQSVALAQPLTSTSKLGTTAVIHTTKGDIVSKICAFKLPRNLLDSSRDQPIADSNLSCVLPSFVRYFQHFRLFPDSAPKAVENFCTHSKDGYYNGIIFHRIIKKFVRTSSQPVIVSIRSLLLRRVFPFKRDHPSSLTKLTFFHIFSLNPDAPNWRSFGRWNWWREYLGKGVRGRVRSGFEARQAVYAEYGEW